MPRAVAYYHFLVSPWSYLAIARLNTLIEHSDATVDYLPIDVGLTFSEMGGVPPGKRHPARQKYRLEELARWSDHLGTPMNLEPKHFPANQTTAACMVHAVAAGHGLASDGPSSNARIAAGRLSDSVLKAVWRDELDISDTDTLRTLADDCALDGTTLLALAGDERVRERYQATTRAAHERGVFGSPTWVVGDELFWGQDRLDFLARAVGVVPVES